MYQQPDYYETRRSNRAQEMNQVLQILGTLAAKKMDTQGQNSTNELIKGLLGGSPSNAVPQQGAMAQPPAGATPPSGASATPPNGLLPQGYNMIPSVNVGPSGTSIRLSARQSPQARAEENFNLFKQKRQEIINNPMADQDTKAAAAAYEFSIPRMDRISKALDSGTLDDKKWTSLVEQVTVTPGEDGMIEFAVPDGSPLEDLIGAVNDMAMTGFGIGGKQFTESEQKIIFSALSPKGKSIKRWRKDLNRIPDLLKAKIKAGTGGRDVIAKIGEMESLLSESSGYSSESEENLDSAFDNI
jgi:hypothetical protein